MLWIGVYLALSAGCIGGCHYIYLNSHIVQGRVQGADDPPPTLDELRRRESNSFLIAFGGLGLSIASGAYLAVLRRTRRDGTTVTDGLVDRK
jgi:hypothetical protein